MRKLSLLLLCAVGCLSISTPAESPATISDPVEVTDASQDPEHLEFQDPFAHDEEGNPPPSVKDPLEPMNRAFFKFNDRVYFWVLKPAAQGYNKVAPEPFRQSIKRFFVNVRYPVRVVNNVLQLKMKNAGVETARFVINSTVGIGGLFDPAGDEWRLQPHTEDLDQTLGFYGIPTGIYLHWPVFGASTVRGTIGTVGDSFLSPFNYLDEAAVIYGSRAFDTVNATSLRLGEYESLKQAAFDPYIALRDAYFDNLRSLMDTWKDR